MLKFLKKLKRLYAAPKTKELMRKVPRVRVLDNDMNRDNDHWRPLIGQQGIFLGSRIDELGEVWDLKLDASPVPHQMVSKERFELLPPLDAPGEKPHAAPIQGV